MEIVDFEGQIASKAIVILKGDSQEGGWCIFFGKKNAHRHLRISRQSFNRGISVPLRSVTNIILSIEKAFPGL